MGRPIATIVSVNSGFGECRIQKGISEYIIVRRIDFSDNTHFRDHSAV